MDTPTSGSTMALSDHSYSRLLTGFLTASVDEINVVPSVKTALDGLMTTITGTVLDPYHAQHLPLPNTTLSLTHQLREPTGTHDPCTVSHDGLYCTTAAGVGLTVPAASIHHDTPLQLTEQRWTEPKAKRIRQESASSGSTRTEQIIREAEGIYQLKGAIPYKHSPKKFLSQTRNLIMNVLIYYSNDGSCKTMREVIIKTAEVTGVSRSTIGKIKSEWVKAKDGVLCSPPPPRRILPIIGQLDDFDRDCIRRELLAFYEHGELPTIEKLLEKVKTPPVNFKGGRTSLYKIVRQLGFKFKKVESGRKYLMEREDIVAARHKYLRVLKQNRESTHPKPEVYLDETWVNQNISTERCWTTDDGSVGPKLKSGRGARFIIVHAGGSDGFIPGGLMMFRSKNGAKGDYHDSMDYPKFKKWFEEYLLPNIPKQSLIIMDNASYHSKVVNKTPVSRNKKIEIVNWLEANNVEYDHLASKTELLLVCKQNKHKEEYEIDNIAACHGHKVLRLPPYHCMLNPIELIWAKIKTEVKNRNSNSNQSVKRVEEITSEAISHVNSEHWRNCIKHTLKIEEEYRAKDRAQQYVFEQFIIHLNSDESADDFSDDNT